MSYTSSSSPPLTTKDFVKRTLSISSHSDVESLRTDAVATENLYRELFARQRDSWEVPEVDDPYLLLVNVFGAVASPDNNNNNNNNNNEDNNVKGGVFQCLPLYESDKTPRCFNLGDARKAAGAAATVSSKSEFDVSWDCFTEGLLRFINWNNVIAAGGAVAGCLSPLPADILSGGPSATRVKRRRYFHDTFLPGSDIDLFLHGLDEAQAEAKLIEIYDAVQAANPYEIRAFRSAHAVTLVSQYPFRHVQVVLRLYNSPAEVLMGFDVDACAVGFDGSCVMSCPRAILSMITQSNTVDMTRRSPSYEMRLAKYARRGYEIVVLTLDRSRVDPFLYEKRFDQARGLARLLLLEKLRTPEERLRYRIEGQLKRGAGRDGGSNSNNWRLQAKLRKMMSDSRNLERQEGTDDVIPPTGVESSDYSTVFLPWGPAWTAGRIEKLMKKKDRILNKIEFTSDGRVVQCRRPYKIHVCAVGTMEEVIEDPFPSDPPIPEDVSLESLEACVRGRLSWLVDNPGRQQIGSFHPITDGDWTEGAYISHATEDLIAAALIDDEVALSAILASCSSEEEASILLHARDFLGRSPLHAAALGCASKACHVLLSHPAADADLLQGRLVDGRTALHLASMRGDKAIVKIILEKRQELASATVVESGEGKDQECVGNDASINDAAVEILDIDGADWEVKLNPLQYAIAFGHVDIVRLLLEYNSSARKVAVHKDRNEGLSVLSLLVFHASESGEEADMGIICQILEALLDAGASTTQINTVGWTCWHELAARPPAMCGILELFLEHDAKRNGGNARALDVLDHQLCSPLFIATACGNASAIKALLEAGATACFSEGDWSTRLRRIQEGTTANAGLGVVRRHNFIPHHTMIAAQEMMRCPIALAAQNADWPCLDAFVSHNSSLANSVIWVAVNNLGRHVVPGIQQRDNKEPMKPLDLLEKVRTQSMGTGNESHIRNMKQNLETRVQEATARLKQAQTEHDNHTKGTYKYSLWSLIVCREEQACAQVDAQLKATELSEEEEQAEVEAIEQIDKSYKILCDAGGEPSKRVTNDTKGADVGMMHQTLFSVGAPGMSNLQDPLQNFSQMPPLDFSSAISMSLQNTAGFWRGAHGKQFTCLPTSDQSKALELMDAAFEGDVDQIQSMSDSVPMCISDSVGSTPLFMAVAAKNIDSLTAICNAARRQFELHLEKIESKIKVDGVDGTGEGDKKGDDDNIVKDQIRRLNNLDIASGEMPQGSRTPDQMRLTLKAAELAAAQQEDSPGGPISSPVSPEALLLHRSIVLRSSEPRLADLLDRLTLEQPDVFQYESANPVRLRPIELAIIRADLDMVAALFDIALCVGAKQKKASGSSSIDKAEENMEDEESSVGDEDGSYEEDGEYYGESGGCYSQQIQDTDISPLSAAQLRWLLAGEGSSNPDFGGMGLLQLAAAVDDCATFCAVAAFAAEHSLPRGAICAWKSEVEEKEEVDGSAKEKRQKETNEIAGVSQLYHWNCNNRLPLWKSGAANSHNPSGHQSVAIFPTLLQFALSIGAKNVSHALMSGDADDALFGWAISMGAPFPDSINTTGGSSAYGGGYKASDGPAFAGRWLIQHVSGSGATSADLALKLVRPTALDGIGRTALFYAPTELIDEVVESAVQAMVKAGCIDVSADTARTLFLEKVSTQGSVTALMAASSAGDPARVQVLCDAGCNRSALHGPKKWGPLHLAMRSEKVSSNGDLASRWMTAREIIRLILDGASELELEESLLCPGAEHTPLMLAADRGADGPTISLLLNKMAESAPDGLARRESELNSAMHLAVRAALSKKGPDMVTRNLLNKDLEGVSILLEWPDSPAVLGPGAENACGITPTELALEAMASVWKNATARQTARIQGRKLHRVNKGKGALPTKPAMNVDDGSCEGTRTSIARQALSILSRLPGSNCSIKRIPVSLYEVQEAKKKATDRAKDSSKTASLHSQRGQSCSDYQSEPNGPPAILGGNRRVALGIQWNQWPSPQ